MSSCNGGLPVTVDLSAYRGDTWSRSFQFFHGSTPEDLTGATVESEARDTQGTVTSLVVTITDALAGKLDLTLPAGGLPAGNYYWDLEETKSGEITTWVTGRLIVRRDVTNELP